MTMHKITISKCYTKPNRGADMVNHAAIKMQAGKGILNDANAIGASPRQVLLVDNQVYKDFDLPETSLRENFRVEGLLKADLNSGDLIFTKAGVVLRVTMPCEPCYKINQIRPGLARKIAEVRGTLARIIKGGTALEGSVFRKEKQVFSSIPSRFSTRVQSVLQEVPSGYVTTYKHITTMAGATKNYIRVIPRVLKNSPDHIPTHRVVSSNNKLIEKHLPDQKHLLLKEGLEINQGRVNHSKIWLGDPWIKEEKQQEFFKNLPVCKNSSTKLPKFDK